MSPDSQPTLTPQAVLGVIIALFGVILTLDNLGLANAEFILRYWPAALIAVGVAICMHAAQTRDWVFGVLWMLGGSLLLARNLDWVDFHPKQLMPLLLVALGARLIWRSPSARKPVTPPPIPPGDLPGGASDPFGTSWHPESQPWNELPPPPPVPPPEAAGPASGFAGSRPASTRWSHFCSKGGRINVFAILGGVERRVRAERFSGAELTAVMGGCELDLREAQMAGDEAQISAFALWGGIEIRVPPDWTVINESTALLGGVEDATRPKPGGGRSRLIVKGFALMGGIEIKN